MKRICILMMLLICVSEGKTQSTYNYRLSFDLPVSTVLASIELTDSCFYACGILSDTLPPYFNGSLFAKLSFEGEVLFYNMLVSPYRSCQTWNNTMEPTNDGNFLVTGNCADSIGRSALLVKYTPDGDTVFTKEYRSPYMPDNNFIAVVTSQKALTDNGTFLLSNITNTINSNTDLFVKKVDSIGQLEWSTIYGENQNSESVESILLSEDKILIGGNLHNINFSNQDYFSRALLIQMTEEGEVDWIYESPEGELIRSVSDVLRTDDGGYLLSSGKGIEYGQAPGTLLYWQPYIFKLDTNREMEWSVNIRDSLHHSSNVINKMIAVSDDSGYVIAGKSYRPNPSENGYDMLGLIAKISKEGDSLWTRRYNHVQSAADEHVFYDLEETPDGGFVMVGQATDINEVTGEYPLQRAWIVKVDQHGCLVPGCHLTSSVGDLQKESFQLKTYPNPATDFVNVHFYHPALKETAYFSLVDGLGKEVLSYKSRRDDVTHMIPVSGLSSGSYWLTCRVGEEVLTKQIVVE